MSTNTLSWAELRMNFKCNLIYIAHVQLIQCVCVKCVTERREREREKKAIKSNSGIFGSF